MPAVHLADLIASLPNYNVYLDLDGDGTPANPYRFKMGSGNQNIGDVDILSIMAGENMIGKTAGILGTPVVATNIRPANTTAYHAKDVLGRNLAVTGASNATPIVVTTATHGLVDGDHVTIAGCVGNTAANGEWYVKVTGYLTTTFALYSNAALTTPSVGNGNWSSGGTVAVLLHFPGIARLAGGSSWIVKARHNCNSAAYLDAVTLHLYNMPPPAILDHSAFTLLWANHLYRVGTIVFPALSIEGAGGDMSLAISTPGNCNLPLSVKCASNCTDLWGVAVDQGTGTPTSAMQNDFELTPEQY